MNRSTFLNKLFGFLFVPKCLGCERILPEADSVLCPFCQTRYELLHHRKCRCCGHDVCTCDCTKEGVESYGVWRLSKLCAYLPHEENSPFKGMLYEFKHNNNSDVREQFACEMTDMIRRKCPDYERYTICYVPRSLISCKKYGYDHMRELSIVVANKLGIGCESLFYREKKARVQKELGRAARFYNAEQTIKLSDTTIATDRRFILLDDVCVTGASLGRCTTLLINDGAREVRSFVIAVRP